MLILPSGELFAGSDNGFVHFNPSSFETSEKAPSVIISKMGVGDKTANGNVDLMEEEDLQHEANSFGFQFSVMRLSRVMTKTGMTYPLPGTFIISTCLPETTGFALCHPPRGMSGLKCISRFSLR